MSDPSRATPNQYRSESARAEAAASYDGILARWPVPHATRFVETSYGATHVIVCGPAEARPLVMLHGLGTNATSWFKVVPPLAARYRVYLVDTIGDLGKSAGTRPAYESGDHARWMGEVLDGLGIDRTLLAGLSAGGWIALHFALARPGRVERLALLAPASLQPMRPPMLLRGAFTMIFDREPVIRGLLRYMAAQEAPVMPEWAMADAVLRWKAGRPNSVRVPVIRDAELGALRTPTLLLLGSDDPIYDARAAEARVRRLVPGVRTQILPQAGHLFPSQHPERTSAALLGFFGESPTA